MIGISDGLKKSKRFTRYMVTQNVQRGQAIRDQQHWQNWEEATFFFYNGMKAILLCL
jgi:hypothetical protein